MRRKGVIGALAGLGVAAGAVAIGFAADRMVRARKNSQDPYADEKLGELPYDEALTVAGPGGLPLHVEVVDPADGIELDGPFFGTPAPSEPTILFVHGFCLDMGAFHFQRKELTRQGEWRAVYYDQPGHGKSGRVSSGEYELSMLAEALHAVLEATVPDAPVVLVGHSMGGMTVLAFAEKYPELFERRVKGVALVASSAGQLAALIPAALLPLATGATRLTGPAIDRVRRAAGILAWRLTRRYGFGGPNPSRTLVSYVERMNARTTTETVARYLRTIYQHDRFPALAALQHKPVLLICGDGDPITPLLHSQRMKDFLQDAELVVVPDAGHMVLLEHPDAVNRALLDFLERL
jgi:pimeloyl-ACP methyl ester carboxylesterase